MGPLVGVSRYDGHGWTTFTTEDGLAHNNVLSALQDRDGHLWFGTWTGGVNRYWGEGKRSSESSTEGAWDTFTTQDGLVDNVVRAIHQDRQGRLWFGTETGVNRHDPSLGSGAAQGAWASFASAAGQPLGVVHAILQDLDGYLWFGGSEGVFRYDERDLVAFGPEDGLALDELPSIMEDSKGDLWFGTRNGDVTRYDGQRWTMLTTEDGVTLDGVLSICEDREQNIWFGTYGNGVTRYDGETWTTFTVADGLASDIVRQIIQDREGNIWFATSSGLSRYDPSDKPEDAAQMWTTLSTADGLEDNTVMSICQDQRGILWIGTPFGLSRHDPSADSAAEGDAWRTYTTAEGLVDNSVISIMQDRAGYLWITTMGGVSRYDPSTDSGSAEGAWRTFTTADGLAGNWVMSVAQDREGDLWFSTLSGLSRYDGRVFQTLTRRDGLTESVVNGVFEDRRGDLWISSSSGATRFRPPAKTPPSISIHAVVSNRRYERVSELTVSTGVGLTAFEYGAMSFKTRPEAMIYRYRLKGLEQEWQTTHDRRVEYEELPVGDYTFEVVAVDRDLAYSQAPATVALTVHYPYGRLGLFATLGIGGSLVVWQTARAVQRDRRLREANEALSLEVAENKRVDRQFQHLNYLYDLRLSLAQAQSPTDVLACAGNKIVEALDGATAVGVRMVYDDGAWTYGSASTAELHGHSAPIVLDGEPRGDLCVYTGLALTDSQRVALVNETAAQVSQTLEARALEQQLLRSARLVSMGEMAAGVAHELNQPLGGISITVADVYLRLRDGLSLSTEELQEMMQHASAMVKRMKGTIEDLRVFSRDTSQAPPVTFSVNEAIHASLRLMGTQLDSHGIALHLELAQNLPPVMGPPHQLEQVFFNLLANARDALDESEGRRDKEIRVRTRFEADRQQLVAEVEDNGPGIDSAHTDQVFEPFYTSKDAARGTGLGLSISYAIVKNHGGELICEGRPGAGARFRVRLPTQAAT